MISKPILHGLAVAGVMLVGSAGLKLAESLQLIDGDTVMRGSQVIVGLALAAYANSIPKSPPSPVVGDRVDGRATPILRVAGWAFTLAGLAYAAFFAFAPAALSGRLSMMAAVGAIAVTLGYCVWTMRRRGQAPER